MTPATRGFREMKSVVVRFAGDSGDGMQIVGERFTDTSVTVPNAIATFPDYPAEIRAPVGTIAGVSAFQVHFGSQTVLTPGDEPDALVAMNPAALAVHLYDLVEGGLLIVNSAAFTEENLAMAGFATNPLDDPGLKKKYEVIALDITGLAVEALKDSPITSAKNSAPRISSPSASPTGSTAARSNRPSTTSTPSGPPSPRILPTRTSACSRPAISSGKPPKPPATATWSPARKWNPAPIGRSPATKPSPSVSIAGAKKAGRDMLFSGYPITPASSMLEALAGFKHFGVKTVQAEDEIAAIGVALGASFAGQIGVTATSGPGMCLKSEFIGLAISTELPLVIVNVQRGGPSTGLPTKTEQSDLLQALYGRHGESPLPVVAANSPSDCFRAAFEAVRIALEFSTPVILLSDGYLANGSEPWKIPDERLTAGNQQTLRRSVEALRHLRPRSGNPRPHPGHPRPAGTGTPPRRPRKGHQGQHQL